MTTPTVRGSEPAQTIANTSDGAGGESRPHVVVIGAGFTGLSAAWELARRGVGTFEVQGERLEKFYHHWFTNDAHVNDLVKELGVADRVVYRPTRTGMYFANTVFRMSSPTDVLRFAPLDVLDRLRLGILALRARGVKDWRPLEDLTAKEWLVRLGGREVYRVVWEPLLNGKFGPFASSISAVWFWNKLKLRGGSRDRAGAEMLAYYRGGFAALADRLAEEVVRLGGVIRTGEAAVALQVREDTVTGVETTRGVVSGDAVLATTALPIFADLVGPHVDESYVKRLRSIDYLANVCLVLELDRSLSSTYWLNVNDPGFPFVGVIEHTNFEPASTYGGRHIVYLSKYLPEDADLFRMSDEEVLEFCVPYLERMFPEFRREWILGAHVWRARFSQPIVVRHYSRLIPEVRTPLAGLYLSTMAQVYPEDRGTNYAIREGRRIGVQIGESLRRAVADAPSAH
jgi:protoporphyrinogen oxidase